jgi:ATP-dependent Lhr-like helicase
MPIAEMALPVRAESRTGDTPQSRRLRQRERPPDLLMTTPESLALLLSYPDAMQFFASLRCVIIDELHSFATSKRGHHLALCLARVATLAPQVRFVGLSATVADPPAMAEFLAVKDEARSCRANPGRSRSSASSMPRSACRGVVTWAITRCPRSTTSSASTRPRSCS